MAWWIAEAGGRRKRPALDGVQLGGLGAQVPQQRLGAEVLSGHRAHQPAGSVTLAVAVDLLAEPGEQGGEIARRNRPVEVAEVGAGGLEELGGVEVAERIGGEVADGAAGPVDVLEAAAGVV